MNNNKPAPYIKDEPPPPYQLTSQDIIAETVVSNSENEPNGPTTKDYVLAYTTISFLSLLYPSLPDLRAAAEPSPWILNILFVFTICLASLTLFSAIAIAKQLASRFPILGSWLAWMIYATEVVALLSWWWSTANWCLAWLWDVSFYLMVESWVLHLNVWALLCGEIFVDEFVHGEVLEELGGLG